MKIYGRVGILTVTVHGREGILTVKVHGREGILTVKVHVRVDSDSESSWQGEDSK